MMASFLCSSRIIRRHVFGVILIMGSVKAVSKDEVESGTMKGVKVGGKEVLVANLGGNFYAIGNRCTHMGCMLSDGELKGENALCPCHGSTFNVRTGVIVKGPAKKPEPVFEVKVEGEDVLVTV
jgi:nitrite reductase/ring-hydroxylating ferredoxin subunit